MFDQLNRDKAQYESAAKCGFIISGISFVLFLPLSVGIPILGTLLTMVGFMGGFIYGTIQINKVKLLSQNFKDKYLVNELKKILPDCTYRADGGFTEQEVIRSGILRNEDRFYSEDLIIGTIKEVAFKSSDVKQVDVRRHDGKTTTTTVFHGRVYRFDFPKPFKDNVMIIQPSFFEGIFKSYRKVEMESIQFNSELSVYSENHHEAFYVLTPHMMERILYLDRKYKDHIRFSFKNELLYISIDTRVDTFDLKAFKVVDERIFTDYQNEFNDMKEFVEILQLDNTIFKQI